MKKLLASLTIIVLLTGNIHAMQEKENLQQLVENFVRKGVNATKDDLIRTREDLRFWKDQNKPLADREKQELKKQMDILAHHINYQKNRVAKFTAVDYEIIQVKSIIKSILCSLFGIQASFIASCFGYNMVKNNNYGSAIGCFAFSSVCTLFHLMHTFDTSHRLPKLFKTESIVDKRKKNWNEILSQLNSWVNQSQNNTC